MKKLLLWSLYFSFIAFNSIAQNLGGSGPGLSVQCQTPESPKVPISTPPSPSVASLLKFDEMPVDHYTGTPSIVEPLISLPVDDNLSINLAIKYHQSGVRVDEYASWVGTGWALEGIGGFVSRTVKGAPDDIGILNNGHLNSVTGATYDAYYGRNFNSAFGNSNSVGKYINDTESDVYTFNFLGQSGKFIFTRVDGVVSVTLLDKSKDYKIEFTRANNGNGSFLSFTITDEKGYRYLFNEVETIENTTTSSSMPRLASSEPTLDTSINSYTSSWHLKSVTNENGLLLATFNYDTVVEKTLSRNRTVNKFVFPESIIQITPIDLLMEPNCNSRANVPQFMLPLSSTSSTVSTSQTKKIREILAYGVGKVIFNRKTENRDDLFDNTGNLLGSILLFESNNNLVSKVEFQYNEFSSESRPFLRSIKKSGALGGNEETLFEYNQPDDLPSRFTNEQDIWGYYNGRPNPLHLPEGDRYLFDLSSVSVNPEFIKTGVLTKIIYPNGGVKELEFESNTYSKINNELLSVFPNPQNTIFEHKTDTFVCTPSATLTNNCKIVYFPHAVTMDFMLNLNSLQHPNARSQAYEVRLIPVRRIDGSIPLNSSVPISQNVSHYLEEWQVELMDSLDFRRPSYKFSLGEAPNTSNTLSSVFLSGYYKICMGFNASMPNVDIDGFSQPFFPEMADLVTYSVSYNLPKYVENVKYVNGGGLRIKSILFKDNQNQIDSSRSFRFNYHTFSNPNQSSGSILSLPTFQYVIQRDFATYLTDYQITCHCCKEHTDVPYPITARYLITTTQSANPIETTNGSAVGYKNIKIENATEGTTELEYTSPEDFPEPTTFATYPFNNSKPSFDYKRGKILKETRKDATGQLKQVSNYFYGGEQETVFSGSFAYQPQMYSCYLQSSYQSDAFKSYGHYKAAFPSFGLHENFCEPLNIITFSDVQNYRYSYNLLNKTETNYFDTGILTNETIYTYTNGKPKTITSELSDGSSHVTENTYSFDYQNGQIPATVLSMLLLKNIVGSPLKTETFKNNELLVSQESIFEVLSFNAVHLQKVVQGKSNNSKRDVFSITKRNATYHKILEYRIETAVVVSLIYDHNYKNILAKIENLAYDSIPAQLITDIQNASNTGTETQLLTALNALRNHSALANAMVTTYTHKPLIGLSTITDPKGDRQTFHYDSFNRLQFVKDKDGNILSENEYHYRTQN